MQFELTEALLDDILFSMEDQDGAFYIDTQEGVVKPRWDADDLLKTDEEVRFMNLPKWDSSSGFRLMERFTATIKNPLIRNELSAALDRGKGVFRAFKDALSQHPEAEKFWFSFKEREMRREVIRWYNALREEWGLEKIGLEPEETDDLVLEDFRFRDFKNEDRAAVTELHKTMRETAEDPDIFPSIGDETPALIAESGSGEFAGYIYAERKKNMVFIRALEVKSEYRGLGIGKALLDYFLEKIKALGIAQVYLDLPAEAEWFSRALVREGFTPRMTRYCKEIRNEE
jgi:N-acetylglutamate synthase-like GNAT family acetyltransferase